MDLKTLFDDYDCDKSSKHSYHEYYEKEFAHLKDEPINFLEIGTYLGASTQAFHDYFTEGNHLYDGYLQENSTRTSTDSKRESC